MAGVTGRVTRRLPLTAGALLTGDTIHRHTSVRGDIAPDLHPLVRRFLHELPVHQTERYAGWCAETVLVSDRLYEAQRAHGSSLAIAQARAALWGAQVSSRLVRPHGDPDHGRPIAPCRSCLALIEWLGAEVADEVPGPPPPGRAGDAAGPGAGAGRVPDEVARVLVASGWCPGAIDTARARSWALALAASVAPDGTGHVVSDAALAAFAEFGGVSGDGGGSGEQVAPATFRLDPLAARYSAPLLAELAELVDAPLTPLGVEGDTGLLAVDVRGRVFLLDHTADWYLGASVDEALTTLVLGRMPARLGDDGSWT